MDNPSNLNQIHSPNPIINNPTSPNPAPIEPPVESITKMDIEPSPSKQINPKPLSDMAGKMSPMKIIKSSPNKQDVSNFNQPEEHITIIFSSFKDAIRSADLPRLKEILRKFKFFLKFLILMFFIEKYQERYDLTNRLDPVSKHISTFLASEIKDDQKCFDVLNLLLQYKANIHFIDNMKQNILFYLAKEGHAKSIEMILNRGLHPEDSDIHGQTPIYYAARDGRADVIKLLLEKGADVNHKDNISNQTCLFYAARDGRFEACKMILESGGLANHMDNKKQTPLHWAKRHNKKEVIELLQAYTTTKHDTKNDKNKGKTNKNQQTQPLSQSMSEQPYIESSNNEPIQQIAPQQSLNIPILQKNVSIPAETTVNIMNYKESNNNNNLAASEEKSNSNMLKKRKREKYEAKISYKLVYTDDFGKSTELTNADFEKFREKYPQIAEIMLKADSLINENLIKENKEKETWEKVAKRILNNVWKLKGAFYFHSPVDPVRLKIDDYFDIVKKPMDFGTVKVILYINYDKLIHFSRIIIFI